MASYSIHLKPAAIDDLDSLRKYDATKILDGIEEHLKWEPLKESRSRIKKLKGKQQAEFRLRIDDWRIFYNVIANEVWILRILHKEDTVSFYKKENTS